MRLLGVTVLYVSGFWIAIVATSGSGMPLDMRGCLVGATLLLVSIALTNTKSFRAVHVLMPTASLLVGIAYHSRAPSTEWLRLVLVLLWLVGTLVDRMLHSGAGRAAHAPGTLPTDHPDGRRR